MPGESESLQKGMQIGDRHSVGHPNRTQMNKINSKDKGARFERHLASRLREYGYDCRRTAQYCGNTGEAADVIGLPGIHIEAKHQEAMRLYEWMEQASRDASGSDDLPTVFHKKNNASILVTMKFEDWMKMYQTFHEEVIRND